MVGLDPGASGQGAGATWDWVCLAPALGDVALASEAATCIPAVASTGPSPTSQRPPVDKTPGGRCLCFIFYLKTKVEMRQNEALPNCREGT